MTAYLYYQQQNLDEAALSIQKVQVDVLTDSMKSIYTTIRDATGVAGIGDSEGPQTQDDNSDEDNYEDTGYDDSYDEYDESYE